jgi:hypothetical protein
MVLQKQLDLFLITRRVWLVRLFPVTVGDGIDVNVNASYLPYFYPYLILFCFLTFQFLMKFNFCIIKKSHFKNFSWPTTNRLSTHQFGKHWAKDLCFDNRSGHKTYLHLVEQYDWADRLCGLVVRVSGYRSRGSDVDSRRFQIFWETACLERGPFSLVRTTEELLEGKSSGSGLENRE